MPPIKSPETSTAYIVGRSSHEAKLPPTTGTDALPLPIKILMVVSMVSVKMPERMGGILNLVFKMPVTSPAAAPAKMTMNAATIVMPFMLSAVPYLVMNTAESIAPILKLPSQVKSAKSSSL